MGLEELNFIEIKRSDTKDDVIVVESPIKGTLIKLEEIKDNDIAAGILGQGIGVIPREGIVKAPFDGIVLSLFPMSNAIGIESETGIQILIHVGINTSVLKKENFISLVEQGDRVRKNQELVRFDLAGMKDEGVDVTTAVLVTNYEKFENIRFVMG